MYVIVIMESLTFTCMARQLFKNDKPGVGTVRETKRERDRERGDRPRDRSENNEWKEMTIMRYRPSYPYTYLLMDAQIACVRSCNHLLKVACDNTCRIRK